MAAKKKKEPAKPQGAPVFTNFRVDVNRVAVAPTIPVYREEADQAQPANDAFIAGGVGKGTFFVDFQEQDDQGNDIAAAISRKRCVMFVPINASPTINRIHVFWGPGDAGVGALTGALRFAANAAGVILFVVPGPIDIRSYVNISAKEIVEALKHREVSRPGTIDELFLSAHSRGFRGLAMTLNQDLLVQRQGSATAPKVPPSVVTRVVNFDAFYRTFHEAMQKSGIPSNKIFGYHVTTPVTVPGQKIGDSDWSASPNQTIELFSVLDGLRAVAYSRLINDAIRIGRRILARDTIPFLVTNRLLLNVPAIGQFSSRSSPVDFRDFCKNGAMGGTVFSTSPLLTTLKGKTAIDNCISDEERNFGKLERSLKGPLIEFINDQNLAGMGRPFSAMILAHQLFVCEFAHEVTDSADPKP